MWSFWVWPCGLFCGYLFIKVFTNSKYILIQNWIKTYVFWNRAKFWSIFVHSCTCAALCVCNQLCAKMLNYCLTILFLIFLYGPTRYSATACSLTINSKSQPDSHSLCYFIPNLSKPSSRNFKPDLTMQRSWCLQSYNWRFITKQYTENTDLKFY